MQTNGYQVKKVGSLISESLANSATAIKAEIPLLAVLLQYGVLQPTLVWSSKFWIQTIFLRQVKKFTLEKYTSVGMSKSTW